MFYRCTIGDLDVVLIYIHVVAGAGDVLFYTAHVWVLSRGVSWKVRSEQ